jgi:hypothetical protein
MRRGSVPRAYRLQWQVRSAQVGVDIPAELRNRPTVRAHSVAEGGSIPNHVR